MTGAKRSLWMNAAAQAVVFALLFQALMNGFACFDFSSPSSHGAASSRVVSGSAGGSQAQVICTTAGVKPLTRPTNDGGQRDGPSNTPHSDCPLCLSHTCCPGAPAPSEDLGFVAPATSEAIFAAGTQRSPSLADASALRNRGPPPALFA